MKKLIYFCLLGLLSVACSQTGDNKIETKNDSAWKSFSNTVFNDSAMVLSGTDAYATTKASYKNFELTFECKTAPDAIGAVIFHTSDEAGKTKGYEVWINNNESPAEWRKTGGLSAIRNFAKCTADNDTWTPMRIKVEGKQITVYVNNIFVTDYTEPTTPYREAGFTDRVLSKGAFKFANYSNSPIAFRKIQVNQLPDDAVNQSEAVDETTDAIIRLQQQNFPTIDYHLHLKGGWTKEQAAAQSRKYGITYAIAPNCGKGFPITDDTGIYEWFDSMHHQPFLMPLQAEGREWVDMFSREAINEFDYRFTDAMTWTDNKGRRMRLWIPEETFVDNKEQFMDMLVERACGIVSTEPINIYVNPTFIPDQLMPEYDKLWTQERMQRIIDSCVKSGVAIEINNRYRIPSPAFIKMAKGSGAKFTFGTNNTSPEDVGKLEYAIEMIKECGLKPADMYIPGSRNI